MKKLMFLVGLFFMSSQLMAETILTPMVDFIPNEEMGFYFEIKTTKFKNVTLDCQSFVTGINFEEENGERHDFYLDMFQCEEAFHFFNNSKNDNVPVCLGVDKDNNELVVTNLGAEDCH